MRPPRADAPLTDWFWALSHDHQVVVVLAALTAIGAIVWLVRAVRDAGQVIDNAPEFEAAHDSRRTTPGPIVQRWSPEIEAQCKEWTDADDAATRALIRDGITRAIAAEDQAITNTVQQVDAYLADMPYDQEQDR